MHFFTVLTYPGGCSQSIIDLATRYCENKFSKYIIITENGKSGQNLHVNIVYEIEDSLSKHWSGNSRKNWIKCYFGLNIPTDQKHMISTKSCSSPANVIGGYLQKEDNFNIVANVGFDVPSLILEAQANKVHVLPKLSLKNAHRHFKPLTGGYGYRVTYTQFLEIMSEELQLGNDSFVPFIPKFKQIYMAFDVAYQNGSFENYS